MASTGDRVRREVHIDNPAPPTELGLGLDIALDGTASSVNGKATFQGTVTCTKPVQVTVTGNVTQAKKRGLVLGSYSTSASCAPGRSGRLDRHGRTHRLGPFQKGAVEVEGRATATDPEYAQAVTVSETVAVRFTRV
ncbi:hypothetical protein [Streptomyces sp. NPDC051677]|uniref:hypothetical protein n=1 Tax=Streptomyces sp. NPDC051677 TaxID=3365669 RepID=UPI0037D43594